MRKLLFLFTAVILAASCRAQCPGIPVKTAGITYSCNAPQWVPVLKTGSEINIDTTTGKIYQWHRTNNSWLQLGQGIDVISGAIPPLYTPVRNMSRFAINSLDELYHYTGSAWVQINQGEVYTAGTGIDITGNEITNTGDLSNTNEAQTISAGGSASPTIGLSTAGGAGGGTVTLSPAGIMSFSRTGNTITATATEVDGSTTNEIELPAQTGNSGKYLTTDGSSPSWATVSASNGLPTGGTSGQVLSKIDGTNYNTTWSTPLGYASIAANQVVYGSSTSAVTSTSTFNYNPSTVRLGVGTASPSTPIHIKSPASKNEVATFEWTTTPGGSSAKMVIDAIWNDRVRIGPVSTGSEKGTLVLLSDGAQQLQIVDSNRKIALSPFDLTLMGYFAGAGATCEQTTVTPWSVRGAYGQTANLVKYQNGAGTTLSGITNLGAFSPPQMTDASAANNTIYYSTTLSKLVYKDPSGSVNILY